jgi:hypothetical protein
MANHGTASQLHVDGGYVEFQQAVLRALPRDIDPTTADGWRNNGESLARVLREALLPPEKPATEAVPTESKPEPALPTFVIVDCDLNPRVPSGLYLTGEGTEHRRMGKVILEKRDGKLYANGREVVRYLSPNQKGSGTIQGHKLRKELKNKQVLNACILDALLANPHLIPDDWKTGVTYFWGTIFRIADGLLYVGCLFWLGSRWDWDYYWLDDVWSFHPAASLAS